MRVIIFWVITLIVLPSVSYAQVDTLMLVEIGTVQASSEITELYVEDLDGDSLKEIILCTDYFVYIYNSQTYQVEWTSPPLLAPTDLLFEDINGDGLIDLSVKDNTNIHLFDPHTPGIIWNSPPLDSTYSCYTIGDRNDDDWIDVTIVSKEPFTRTGDEDNRDTVWIEAYDGPTFNLNETNIITMNNFFISGPYETARYRIEFPTAINIDWLDGNDGHILRYIIFSYSDYVIHWIFRTNTESGNVFIQNCLEDTTFVELSSEFSLNHEILRINNRDILYNIGKLTWYDGWIPGQGSLDIRLFTADSLVTSNQIWNLPVEHSAWRGFTLYDVNPLYLSNEFFYGNNDTIHCLTYDGSEIIWEANGISQPFRVLHALRINSMFNFPQIVCGISNPISHYEFYNGSDGSLSAVLPEPGFEQSHIADLNSDSNDEILSIQGSALYIYNLDYATGVGDNTRLPQRAFLRTNYPNPFNSSTTIEYGLPEAGHVIVEIYDLLGRKVEMLVNEEKQAGRHQVLWEADRYASGLYFYRIEAGDYSDTKRMIYLK